MPVTKTSQRKGKPQIWATHLAKLLGGDKCTWSAWFKAHHWYPKFEEMAGDLEKWNRDHTQLMAKRRAVLEADGWTVTVENDNAFELEGSAAVVGGKPDLLAVKGDRLLVVDGKTGRERESDVWQVLIYLFAVPKAIAQENDRRLPHLRRPVPQSVEGEVYYGSASTIDLSLEELTEDRKARIFRLINVIARDTPPAKHPSREECKRCNIGPRDCPQRVMAVAVGEF